MDVRPHRRWFVRGHHCANTAFDGATPLPDAGLRRGTADAESAGSPPGDPAAGVGERAHRRPTCSIGARKRWSGPVLGGSLILWGSRTLPCGLSCAFYAAGSYSLSRPPRTARLAGPVRALSVVVPGVLGQYVPEVTFAEDQHAVGQLGSGGQHESLRESVRAGAAGRDLHDVDAGACEHGVEGGAELAGPVPDEVAEPGSAVTKVEEEISGLLGGPRPVGVGGDPEDVEVAGFYLEGDQHVEPPQRHGVDVEEVHRQGGGGLDAQELPPAAVAAAGRRRRYPGPLQDPADRRGGDPVTELAQLTLQALVSPRIARSAQSSRGRGFLRRRTATSCRSTSSSASFDAVERASSTSQPTNRTKIR